MLVIVCVLGCLGVVFEYVGCVDVICGNVCLRLGFCECLIAD